MGYYYRLKVNVQSSLCLIKRHAMKEDWGSGGIAPLIHPQGKSPWYPLDRRLSGPQSRSGRGGKEKNSKSLRESNIITG
jgi:hypothetical protein